MTECCVGWHIFVVYRVLCMFSVCVCVCYTVCGRKNTPIWEGHSFGWGARTVVGSASLNSGVHAIFNVHHAVVGRTLSLYC